MHDLYFVSIFSYPLFMLFFHENDKLAPSSLGYWMKTLPTCYRISHANSGPYDHCNIRIIPFFDKSNGLAIALCTGEPNIARRKWYEVSSHCESTLSIGDIGCPGHELDAMVV
jgi:hypothetical protein